MKAESVQARVLDKTDELTDELEVDRYRRILDQPHKFGELLKTTFKESNTAKDALRNAIKDLLSNDVQTRSTLKGIIRGIERENWKWFMKSVFKGSFAVITFFIGILGAILVLWLTKKLGI